MKKITLSVAVISALAASAPAAAQYSGTGYEAGADANGNIAARVGQLRMRLQAGVQSGTISRQEAGPLRQQLQQLSQLERQYSVNGISGRERADLQQRLRTLRQQLRVADGGNQRWDRDNSEDGYDRNGQYSRSADYGRDGRYGQYDRNDRVDGNNDGYDDRDYARDGRWDDDRQGDDYRQPVQRGGLAGVVDALMGGRGLRVGQRASENLYGVPSEYRGQYRDGNGAYYRSDGRQIYQIDARTDTVVRVFPMGR
ncbi:MAG TPA: hypothetical protein VF631_11920 [Allosphingosinicella sp.]|jgi:hypothetical protein|uniref:hypothetical protein n=1 Tax=Allosphingosinicella sp. TaxID=2823234 RepID=UPI002F271EFF